MDSKYEAKIEEYRQKQKYNKLMKTLVKALKKSTDPEDKQMIVDIYGAIMRDEADQIQNNVSNRFWMDLMREFSMQEILQLEQYVLTNYLELNPDDVLHKIGGIIWQNKISYQGRLYFLPNGILFSGALMQRGSSGFLAQLALNRQLELNQQNLKYLKYGIIFPVENYYDISIKVKKSLTYIKFKKDFTIRKGTKEKLEKRKLEIWLQGGLPDEDSSEYKERMNNLVENFLRPYFIKNGGKFKD
ncbi:MAG: hypothetical protein GF364_20080 [Candidatus Lokiarchaeota archaeon]|nr:hypothetical protein [Candidatus Lokiarchaeota archaeon]